MTPNRTYQKLIEVNEAEKMLRSENIKYPN